MAELTYSQEEGDFISKIIYQSESIFLIGGKSREGIDRIDTPMFLKGNDEVIIASLVAHMAKNPRVLDLMKKTLESYNRQNN